MPVRVSFPPMLGCAPTAQPSDGLVVNTEYRPSPGATASGIGKLVQVAPFHQAVRAFPVLLPNVPVPLYPTAHPSPLPGLVLKVSTWTDLHTAVGGARAALPMDQTPPLFVVVIMVL